MLSLVGLGKATGNLKRLRAFVEEGALEQAVAEIGGIEVDAARLALANLSAARNPEREVGAAVVHLQSAHAAFKSVHATDRYQPIDVIYAAARNDAIACCLMATCYVYLDEAALAGKSIEHAEAAAQWFTFSHALSRAFSHPYQNWRQGVGAGLRPIRYVKSAWSSFDFEPAAVRAFGRSLEGLRSEP